MGGHPHQSTVLRQGCRELTVPSPGCLQDQKISPDADAAGIAVSLRFDVQINRIGAARDNVGNATSFAQTQIGFLQKAAKASGAAPAGRPSA